MSNPKAERKLDKAIQALEKELAANVSDTERREREIATARELIGANEQAIQANATRKAEILTDLEELRKIEL